jgi:glycosyltransferase involved in cell wall biosynthesis
MISAQVTSTSRTPCHVLFVIDQLKKPLGGAEQVLLKMVSRLPADRFRCSVVTFACDLSAEDVASIPCPLHVFPMTCAYDLNSFRVAFRLAALIRSENVRIVHTFFETSDLWAGTVVRLTSNAKLVSSRRDMGILRSAKHRIAYRCLAHLAHKVLTVSEHVRQFVISADHLSPDRVLTIHNGLDFPEPASAATTAAIRESLGLPCRGGQLITAVGNLRMVKGFDVLIDAAAEVCARFREASFVVAGGVYEASYRDELLNMVERLGLSERFHFIGHQANVFPLLCATDVFVLPSRSEGFSNALLEAMAAGRPAVATRVGGNAEAIVQGKTGFLVEPEDREGLADQICRLLQTPEQAEAMGRAAQEAVKTKFSMENMIEGVVGVYDGLLLRSHG